jgi:carbon monoxide dehydrogenase subunit G
MKSEDSIVLAAPPERVWEVLSDWTRYAEWMPDVAWVRPLVARRGRGLRLLVRTRVFGLPVANDVMEVTEWQPPTRLGIRHTGVVSGPAEWRLDRTREGTRFVWSEDVRLAIPVFGELALRAYWPWQRRMFRRSMLNLGQILAA